LLYYYLYFSKDRLENPTIENLISLYNNQTGVDIEDGQIRLLTEQLHEDISMGRLPIVRGVRADVSPISNRLKEADYIGLIREFQLVMWQIVGAGFLEMGHEADSGDTAEQYMAISRKQATGVIRQFISDFINDTIIADPWSGYEGLTFNWKIAEEQWTKKDEWRIKYPTALNTQVISPEELAEQEFPEIFSKRTEPFPPKEPPAEAAPEEPPVVQSPSEAGEEQKPQAPLPTGRKSTTVQKSEETELPDWAADLIRSIELDLEEWGGDN
jgi:hypothetical protein